MTDENNSSADISETMNDNENGNESENLNNESEILDELTSEIPDEDKDILDLPLPESEEDDTDNIEDKEKEKIEKAIKKRLKSKQREIARKDAEINALRAQAAQAPLNHQSSPNHQLKEPIRDEFEDDATYMRAAVDYQIQKRLNDVAEMEVKQKQQEEIHRFQENVQDLKDKGAEKYEDFYEITQPILHGPGFPSNIPMCKAILKSEYGADILYMLGKNPEKAKKIALQDAEDAVKKIVELDNKFREARKKKVTTNKFSPPVAFKNQPGSIRDQSPETVGKMSQSEFEKWYKEKHKKAW